MSILFSRIAEVVEKAVSWRDEREAGGVCGTPETAWCRGQHAVCKTGVFHTRRVARAVRADGSPVLAVQVVMWVPDARDRVWTPTVDLVPFNESGEEVEDSGLSMNTMEAETFAHLVMFTSEAGERLAEAIGDASDLLVPPAREFGMATVGAGAVTPIVRDMTGGKSRAEVLAMFDDF